MVAWRRRQETSSRAPYPKAKPASTSPRPIPKSSIEGTNADQESQRKLGHEKIKIGKKGFRLGHTTHAFGSAQTFNAGHPCLLFATIYLPTISWARATKAGEAA